MKYKHFELYNFSLVIIFGHNSCCFSLLNYIKCYNMILPMMETVDFCYIEIYIKYILQ